MRRLAGLAVLLLIAPAVAVHAQEAPITAALTRCFEAGQACTQQEDASRDSEERSAQFATSPGDREVRDDSKFHALIGAFITAAATDVGLSMYKIGRGTARERGFGAWWQDSPVTFGITKSGAIAFATYGLHKMHRTRPKTAFILGLAATSFETALVARSAFLKPHGR